MENKYKNGKIYKIINDEMKNKVYYGSTTQTLGKRLSGHKSESKKNKSNSSKPLFEFGTPKIILIQNKPCNSKKELEKRESFYIRNFECINKKIPTRSQKEYKEDNKEKYKEYRKEYYENNKEKLCNRNKEWHKNNKDKLKQIKNKYQQKNKEKRKEKFNCACEGKYSYTHKARHLKSKKHQNYLDSLKK